MKAARLALVVEQVQHAVGRCLDEREARPVVEAARVLAERIGAELLTVPGFYPQTQQPDAINDALATLWAVAS